MRVTESDWMILTLPLTLWLFLLPDLRREVLTVPGALSLLLLNNLRQMVREGKEHLA